MISEVMHKMIGEVLVPDGLPKGVDEKTRWRSAAHGHDVRSTVRKTGR